MVRRTAQVLRRLGDASPRNDVKGDVSAARTIAKSLERLLDVQQFPDREDVAAKSTLSKSPARSWRAVKRQEELERIFAEEIMPTFLELDERYRGQTRFTIVLTYASFTA